jgi:hypothetical protein
MRLEHHAKAAKPFLSDLHFTLAHGLQGKTSLSLSAMDG